MHLSRRKFLGHSAAVGVGIPFMPGSAAVATPTQEVVSGLKTGKPVPLSYEHLGKFLSKEQIRWHHESHYGGALKGFIKLDKHITHDHRKRMAKANSVLLHELYFENMTMKEQKPGKLTSKRIQAQYGSNSMWLGDFRGAAMSSRGWASLIWHPVNGKLYNVAANSHDDGVICSGVPLLVVDMYEHAYYLDFQNRKGDYVDAFLQHINWEVVERRLLACTV